MSDYFVGEIRMFSMNWAPYGWALCNGALVQVMQNQALFSLIGAQFGGDGRTNFALPDLRGRAPLMAGTSSTFGSYRQGIVDQNGVEAVTLITNQVPLHTHTVKAVSALGTATLPAAGASLASAKPAGNPSTVPLLYGPMPATAPAAINSGTIGVTGGAAHNNMQPYAVTNFCISTSGIYPSRP